MCRFVAIFSTYLALSPLALTATEAPTEKSPSQKGDAALTLLKLLDEGFSQVFEKVAPSVVIIEATKRASKEEPDELKGFEYFLDERRDAPANSPENGPSGKSSKLPSPPDLSEGSGFIIRANGFILTNHHLIANAEKIQVRLKDGRKFLATIAGVDEPTDIALLRIDAKDLPSAELGNSNALRVGQLVCAIGTPFNQDYSFTVGWVSGKNRTNLLRPTSPTILYENYIQTDAFINPGNSGGPLFDVEGKVVGMNTLIHGLGRGLAFAIPSAMLIEVGEQLIASGRVQRPWLGIRIETLSENSKLREKSPSPSQGVVVETIEANAPASKSDLRAADVITEAEGIPVLTALDFQKQILKAKIGQVIQLTVWRDGQSLKVSVPTGKLPETINKASNTLPKKPAKKLPNSLSRINQDAQPNRAPSTEIILNNPSGKFGILSQKIINNVAQKSVSNDKPSHFVPVADSRVQCATRPDLHGTRKLHWLFFNFTPLSTSLS
jgi:serine protease Do